MNVFKLYSFVVFLILGTLAITAQAAVIDITTLGSSGTANGAIFQQWNSTSSQGSGLIDPFLRIQANHTESGFNNGIEGTPNGIKPLDDVDSGGRTFDHVLLLNTIPVVNIGGTDYRELSLDINQNGSNPYLSLDQLKIYNTSNNGITTIGGLNALTPIYDLGGNMVGMNYSLNGGSGNGDVLVYIPDSTFAGGQYVYLYSQFGASTLTSPSGDWSSNDGFEEWAVRIVGTTPPAVPAPGAILLGGIGVTIVGWLRKRRTI